MRKNCSSWSFQICGTLSLLIAFMSCSSIGCCFEECCGMTWVAPAQWPGYAEPCSHRQCNAALRCALYQVADRARRVDVRVGPPNNGIRLAGLNQFDDLEQILVVLLDDERP